MRLNFYFPPFRNIKKYFLALLLACLHLTLLTNEARANCVFDEDQVKINIKDYKKFIKTRLPRGLMGNADEVFPMLLFLCSKHSSMMGGCLVPMDAGEGKSYQI